MAYVRFGLLLILLTSYSIAVHSTALPTVIRIGAIFETGDESLLNALNMIVDRINNDQIILPRSRLEVLAHFIEPRDSFNAAKFVCHMLKSRIWMVFSSKSASIDWFARSLANTLHVPHMSVNWDYRSLYLNNVNHGSRSQRFSRIIPTTFGTIVHGPNGGFYQDQYGTAETGFRVVPSERTALPVQTLSDFTINLYPEATQLSEAFMSFIESRNWKSFIMIYDTDESFILVKDLLRIPSREKKRKIKFIVMHFEEFEKMTRMRRMMLSRLKRLKKTRRQVWSQYNRNYPQRFQPIDTPQTETTKEQSFVYRKLMKEIKKSEHNFVLSLNRDRVINILREAHKMNRLTEYDNFLVTSLDMHTYDLREFQYLEPIPNITSLSLLSPENQQLDEIDYTLYRPNFASNVPYKNSLPNRLKTMEALVYDSITVFARALDDLDRSKPELIVEPFISCNDTKRWPLGSHIVNYMRNMHIKGITGMLIFDDYGHRVNFSMDVLQLKPDGLKNVAKWSRESGLKLTTNYSFDDVLKQILETMKYKVLKVTVPPKSPPYIQLKENHELYEGNDKFEGFCVDLLEEIGKVFRIYFNSDFKYSLRLVADGKYGKPNKETGEWDGMFGELMRHQADLAIADLTATYLRETAVDFTMPFMNLGIAILFKKPGYPPTELFSFLKPFSDEVWLYLVSAFLGVSMLLWFLSRISPYEWISPHSCDPEPLELENQFSIGNSLWFTIGYLMQQGSDLAPRALSTRFLASVWSFFALIMISSYTANLAASLTISQMASAINSVDDLAKQNTILYGCKNDGSTYEFFKNSNDSRFQRMFNAMQANPEVYIKKLEDAVDRVRKGDYAYLAESSTIEHLVQRQCDLIQVGSWLDSKGYGIATPTDSPYRTPISNAITVLQDNGMLYELKKRWWETKGGGQCGQVVKVSSAQELNIENVGGVFVVLVGGVCIGCLCGGLEFIWKALKIARDERESVGKLIWLEIVRICTGGSSSRPVYTAQQSSNGTENSQNNSQNAQPNNGRSLTKNSSYQESLFGNGNFGYMSSPDYTSYLDRYPDDPMASPVNLDSSAPLLSSSKSLNRLGVGPTSPTSANSFASSPHPYTIY